MLKLLKGLSFYLNIFNLNKGSNIIFIEDFILYNICLLLWTYFLTVLIYPLCLIYKLCLGEDI